MKPKLVEFCCLFTAYVAALIVLASLDLMDFHVCIKPAGHCKIIDPTEVKP